MKAKILISDLHYGAKFAFPRHPDLLFKFLGLSYEKAVAKFTFVDDFDCSFLLYCGLTDLVCLYE